VTIVSIAQQIRQANQLGKEVITVADWGVDIEIRSMSAGQRAALQSLVADDALSTGDRQEKMWGFLLLHCCFEVESGQPVFTESDLEWILNESAFGPIDYLTTKCLEVSAIGKKASDDLGKSS
jgi:hypothetical protein